MLNKRFIRVIAAVLALLMVLPMTIACGDNKKNPSASTPNGEDLDNNRDNLPALDFDGEEVNFLTRAYETYHNETTVDDASSSDIVDMAVWKREQTVEQRLNITIVNERLGESLYDYTVIPDEFRTEILAGTNNYDIGVSNMAHSMQYAGEGLYYDLQKVPYIELSQPYYSQGVKDGAIIGGKLFGVSGDATLTYISYLGAVFFNRTMAEELKIEDLYQVVLDGKWTLEKQIALSKDVYSDVNGDTKRDIGDKFGYIAMEYTAGDPFGSAFDLPIFKRDASGAIKFAVNVDKTSDMLKTVNQWLWQTQGAFLPSPKSLGLDSVNTMKVMEDMFANDRVLFMSNHLAACETASLRNMESLYGILPHPKYDENQQQYGSYVYDVFCMYLVSAAVPESRLELVGATIECMFSESEKCRHALFEEALKVKYQSTEKTGRMLDIIADTVVLDSALVFTYVVGGLGLYVGDLVSRKTHAVAGFWKMNQGSIEKKMAAFEADVKKLK